MVKEIEVQVQVYRRVLGCDLGNDMEKYSTVKKHFVLLHLLHHPMVKFALQKYLNTGLNIKRVILPCRDI